MSILGDWTEGIFLFSGLKSSWTPNAKKKHAASADSMPVNYQFSEAQMPPLWATQKPIRSTLNTEPFSGFDLIQWQRK